MKKLFSCNVDVRGQDAGCILIGATSLDEAKEKLNLMLHRRQHQITYLGDLQESPSTRLPIYETYNHIDCDGLVTFYTWEEGEEEQRILEEEYFKNNPCA